MSWRRRVGAEPTAVIEMVPTKPRSRRKRILLIIGTVLVVLMGAGGTYVAVMGGFPASADVPRPTPAPLTVVTLPPVIPRAASPTAPASEVARATTTPGSWPATMPVPTTQAMPSETAVSGATTAPTPSPTRTKKHGGGGGDQGN